MSKVTDLQQYVTSLPPDADPLVAVLPAAHLLFRAERTLTSGLAPVDDNARLQSDFFHSVGLRAEASAAVRKILNEAYAKTSWGQVAFDARNPESRQRNVFLDSAEVFQILRTSRLPKVTGHLLRAAGARPEQQLRTLLCDRQILLAWVALYRPEPFSVVERRDLTRLFGTVRERLLLARQLPPELLAASFTTALEAVGGAAFITGPSGRVLHANAAGRARLEKERRDTTGLLSETVLGRLPDGSTCTPISAAGTSGHQLVILRDRERQLEEQAARAVLRWRLTRRQAEVLDLVARGLANKSIAQLLGCAEHTVEHHVSAILQRVGVESRSALAALVAGQ